MFNVPMCKWLDRHINAAFQCVTSYRDTMSIDNFIETRM